MFFCISSKKTVSFLYEVSGCHLYRYYIDQLCCECNGDNFPVTWQERLTDQDTDIITDNFDNDGAILTESRWRTEKCT